MDIIRGEEVLQRLDEFVDRAANDERLILSHGGKQVALVSFEDLMFLEEADRRLDELDAEEVTRRLADPAERPAPLSELQQLRGA